MSAAEHERIDTLLALAIAFGRARNPSPVVPALPADAEHVALSTSNASSAGTSESSADGDIWHVLSLLDVRDREIAERRAAWYAKLPAERQAMWLGRTLRRARPDAQPLQLDEHVHPTHIVEALRDEPRRIQTLILRHIPANLAEACAHALGLKNVRRQRPSASPGGRYGGRERRSATRDEPPDTEIVAFVRRRFIARFVHYNQLHNPTPLDSLNGAELARLIRLSGVREAAIACRGVAQVENIASLWRRFPAEDARAFAAHMATLADVEPARVSFAEELVGEALRENSDPIAMLDHTGMLLLALVMYAGDTKRMHHTSQKLPLSAALWLREISDQAQQQYRRRREVAQLIARETETLATNLRRASKRSDKHAAFDEPFI